VAKGSAGLRGSWEKLLFPATVVLLAVVLAGVIGRDGPRTALELAIFAAAMIVHIPIHELGHAAAGAIGGLRIARVVVGTGRVVAERRFGGVTFQLKQIPAGGATLATPFEGTRFVRARVWLFGLGGPLASAATAVLLWKLAARFGGASGAGWVLSVAASACAFSTVFNLIPMRVSSGSGTLASDGLQLLTTPFMKPAAVTALFAGYYALQGADLLLHGDDAGALAWFERGLARYPDQPVLRLCRASVIARAGRAAEAKAEAEAVLAALPAGAPLRPIALNDWSWHAYILRDERDLRAADRRSAEAVALLPEVPPVSGTRGAVLLWQGRVAEALPLLTKALRGAEAPRSRASDACLLAIAHAARGEVAIAAAHVEAARAVDPGNLLLPEAAAAVTRAGEGTPVVRAARGGRTVAVHADGVELGDGGGGPARRLALAEVTSVDAGLTARGRAQLGIVHAGRRWRLPVAESALGAARLALHGFFAGKGTPAPAAQRFKLAVVGPLAAAAVIFSLASKGMSHGEGFVLPLLLVVGVIATLVPGPGPLIALGTTACLSIASHIAGAGGLAVRSWRSALVQAAAGILSLAVGLAGARAAPDARKRGLRVTVIALGAMLVIPAVVAGLDTLRLHGATLLWFGDIARAWRVVGIAATSLAVVVAVLMPPRRRPLAAALVALGALWFCAGSAAFQERVARRSLGPPPPPLAWTSEAATVVAQRSLPPGTYWVAVSPDGASFAAEIPPASDDDGPKLSVGPVAGAAVSIDGVLATFVDDRRLAVASHVRGWAAREIALAEPLSARRTVALFGLPAMFADDGGTVHVSFPYLGDPLDGWIWSTAAGLVADAPVPNTAGRADVGLRLGAGKLHCAARPRGGRLLCVTHEIQPPAIVAIDPRVGAIRRIAALDGWISTPSVLRDGRVAVATRNEIAVIDLDQRRAVRLTFPSPEEKFTYYRMAAEGLAVTRVERAAKEDEEKVTLLVLAPPRFDGGGAGALPVADE
jgi:tetratricopeptide (TPR) repeat protein